MQRGGCKVMNESHLNTIALKARLNNRECGHLWKRATETSGPSGKWQYKWYALYQNFLFCYENVNSTKPLGVILLESVYCQRIIADIKNTKEGGIKLYCFSISFSKDGKNPIEFGAESEQECLQWIDSIINCSFNRQASLNAELHEKYVHLQQLYNTESRSKWECLDKIEFLTDEIKKLKDELKASKREYYLLQTKALSQEESIELKRIRKVQSLCKGWLYRKRWKRIVKEYIESPHATSLRKRNRFVFELVEKEGEYMSQLEVLVTNFLIPFRMAACSSKPPITHEEINCIFLNSEILLFLHQIFYKGLCRKLDNWPTLFIGDLFDFLLPVLVIYQEYVRNHHYSLQILTELKSKSIEFRNLLKRSEEKSKCDGRSLDVILTYPMHQIPRYIIVLHQLIAHTSPSSVNEHKSLENAKNKLEELSSTMRDEVSETENIRCNLAIEKMIVEGCECLLDSNQLFIKEGLLIIYTHPKCKSLKTTREERKRNVVKCFLFTNHLVVTKRASNGRLNLFKPYETISLNECRIVEDITTESTAIEEENVAADDYTSLSSVVTSESALFFFNNKEQEHDVRCEFQLIQTNNSIHRTIHFIASSTSEKSSWCSDISHCIDNLNFNNVLQSANKSNSINMPNKEMHIVDPKLFKDEKDVKYCKSYNSCKVPQIRHATKEKLEQRLVDLRFLSIDFLNTFLLTYRVFSEPLEVLGVLRNLYESSPRHSMDLQDNDQVGYQPPYFNELSRRISLALTPNRLMPISEEPNVNKHKYYNNSLRRADFGIKKIETVQEVPDSDEKTHENNLSTVNLAPIASSEASSFSLSNFSDSKNVDATRNEKSSGRLTPNLKQKMLASTTDINTVLSSVTKTNVTDGIGKNINSKSNISFAQATSLAQQALIPDDDYENENLLETKYFASSSSSLNDSISSASNTASILTYWKKNSEQPLKDERPISSSSVSINSSLNGTASLPSLSSVTSLKKLNKYSRGFIAGNYILSDFQQNKGKKLNETFTGSGKQQFAYKSVEQNTNKKNPISIYAGVVVTSSRSSRRRISNVEATKLFALATSGSSQNKNNHQVANNKMTENNRTNSAVILNFHKKPLNADWVIVNTAASMRVLNVLRHWVAKHPMDFIENLQLKEETVRLLEKMLEDINLTDTEKKVAEGIVNQLNMPTQVRSDLITGLDALLAQPENLSTKFYDLSVSEIAEQMTYMDCQIFCSISSQELLGQAWMGPDKEKNAKNVLLFSKRFNEISQLVVSEILMSSNLSERLDKLEKWTTIANICHFLKNFNGVLQIMSAFASTSIFRLKKTWEHFSKNSKQTVDCLQNLVSSDGRFKNLRDAMHKCDPPLIPYLGMYLMDLVFIEESTPDTLDESLVNFAKLRMVSHIIRDIRTFQHSKYTIHYQKRVCDYLLNTSKLLTPDEAWKKSLELEPRNPLTTLIPDSCMLVANSNI